MRSTQSSAEYFEDWHPYDQLIAQNYMRHREITVLLKSWADENPTAHLNMLELGCGNCIVTREAFGHLEAIDFTGVDLSKRALGEAKKNLSLTSWNSQLIEGDIEAVIAELNDTYHLIVAGYCLHHFREDPLMGILQHARKRLKDSGELLIFDIVSRENESRTLFTQRLIQGVYDCPLGLDEEQIESLRNHISNYDYPMDLKRWGRFSKAAGFSRFECRYRDENEYFALLKLS